MEDELRIPDDLLREVWQYPLGNAITGRRSRRFGLGMEIPDGPLTFKSRQRPLPLSEAETAILLCAATGVTGWNFGIPYSTATPGAYPSYTTRFTGRTFPTGAGIGAPEVFYTDDSGAYLAKTRDLAPEVEQPAHDAADFQSILRQVKRATVKLADSRLKVPREPPHISEHNLWNANWPGSLLLMPVTDLSEHFLTSLTMRLLNGYLIYDDEAQRFAGNLAPFVRSGLIDEAKKAPLSGIEQGLLGTGTAAIAILCHGVVLVMQAMGLGGWMYSGINGLAAMGSLAEEGYPGLGFRFVRDDRWEAPNPVGLDGHYQAYCPPYHTDMRSAVRAYAAHKFGQGGTYDSETAGPFSDSRGVKGSVVVHSEEFVDCMAEVAQYVYDKHNKFPGTAPTILMGPYVQAQHLDTDFYDAHFREGAYLDTHKQHLARWHDMA